MRIIYTNHAICSVSNCLPALSNDAVGVLLVYDITADDHVTELEELYNVWSNYLQLNPSRYLVVARKWGDGQPNRKRTIKMGISLTLVIFKKKSNHLLGFRKFGSTFSCRMGH